MVRPDFSLIWGSDNAPFTAIEPSDYTAGWVFRTGAPPRRVNFDYFQNLSDQRTAWLGEQMLLTVGHEWQSDVTYDAYAIVRSPVNDQLYRSLVGSNLNNEPSVSGSQWALGVGVPANIQTSGIRGSHSNLKASATGLSAVVTVTADAVCLKNASNEQVVLNAVSVSPSFANSGANGLDVGAGGSQTASTWYYIHVIWNGTTSAGLISLSDTAPTLPSGYTHFAMVSAVRTDATANKFPFPYYQENERAQWAPASGSNMTLFPIMASTTATLAATAIAVANHAPGRAGSVIVRVRAVCNSGTYFTAYVGASTFFPFISGCSSPVGVEQQLLQCVINLQSTNIAWQTAVVGAGAASIESQGFILNL